MDDVCRRVQQEVLGYRGRKGDPLYGIRRLLLVVPSASMSEAEFAPRRPGAGDRFDEVGAAWTATELLRAVYGAGRRVRCSAGAGPDGPATDRTGGGNGSEGADEATATRSEPPTGGTQIETAEFFRTK
ncbi:MAG TPA: hypothetical protein VGR26_06640 [Acidimicrobiales bacterium]|nr:hypothetical protein [Acidimicrobiales bacterium]